jgi:hypothetical protein
MVIILIFKKVGAHPLLVDGMLTTTITITITRRGIEVCKKMDNKIMKMMTMYGMLMG